MRILKNARVTTVLKPLSPFKLVPQPPDQFTRMKNVFDLIVRTVSREYLCDSGKRSGTHNVNFRKISVQKTIWDLLEFSEHLLQISCLPASPRIFEHLKNGVIAHFKRILTLKRSPRVFGSFFLDEIFEKVSFDPYNFRIPRLSARKSEQIKNF